MLSCQQVGDEFVDVGGAQQVIVVGVEGDGPGAFYRGFVAC